MKRVGAGLGAKKFVGEGLGHRPYGWRRHQPAAGAAPRSHTLPKPTPSPAPSRARRQPGRALPLARRRPRPPAPRAGARRRRRHVPGCAQGGQRLLLGALQAGGRHPHQRAAAAAGAGCRAAAARAGEGGVAGAEEGARHRQAAPDGARAFPRPVRPPAPLPNPLGPPKVKVYKKVNPEPVTYNSSSWELRRWVKPRAEQVRARPKPRAAPGLPPPPHPSPDNSRHKLGAPSRPPAAPHSDSLPPPTARGQLLGRPQRGAARHQRAGRRRGAGNGHDHSLQVSGGRPRRTPVSWGGGVGRGWTATWCRS
jgi:hypothetical protein